MGSGEDALRGICSDAARRRTGAAGGPSAFARVLTGARADRKRGDRRLLAATEDVALEYSSCECKNNIAEDAQVTLSLPFSDKVKQKVRASKRWDGRYEEPASVLGVQPAGCVV